MQIRETESQGVIEIEIFIKRAIVKTTHILAKGKSSDEIYNAKFDFIEDVSQKSSELSLKGNLKGLLKAYAKIDERFATHYKQMFPRGGNRGGGRKKGSLQTTPKSERTKRFNRNITHKELEYLNKCLEDFRSSCE